MARVQTLLILNGVPLRRGSVFLARSTNPAFRVLIYSGTGDGIGFMAGSLCADGVIRWVSVVNREPVERMSGLSATGDFRPQRRRNILSIAASRTVVSRRQKK
ncbi:hypothetical protein K438DRAFT_1820329 [Mycena galopus ATCC 62051]|nr:hypothetical protein K438DRAFT_1820329 [Mycena galopus ATCC 62051]